MDIWRRFCQNSVRAFDAIVALGLSANHRRMAPARRCGPPAAPPSLVLLHHRFLPAAESLPSLLPSRRGARAPVPPPQCPKIWLETDRQRLRWKESERGEMAGPKATPPVRTKEGEKVCICMISHIIITSHTDIAEFLLNFKIFPPF